MEKYIFSLKLDHGNNLFVKICVLKDEIQQNSERIQFENAEVFVKALVSLQSQKKKKKKKREREREREKNDLMITKGVLIATKTIPSMFTAS